MTIRLLIVRHGTTFSLGEAPRRIGARTDLPLSSVGIQEATSVGNYLAKELINPSTIFSSELLRAKNTASIIRDITAQNLEVTINSDFNEIDYGIDEGKPEDEVITRLGKEALEKWNKEGVVPRDWIVDVDNIKLQWSDFGKLVSARTFGDTVLVVTSNGVGRFCPVLLGDFEGFRAQHQLKLATGSISTFIYSEEKWNLKDWNVRPPSKK